MALKLGATHAFAQMLQAADLSCSLTNVRGALFGICSPAGDILRQIAMYRGRILKLDELETRRYALDDVNDAVQDLLEGRNIRGVIMHEH